MFRPRCPPPAPDLLRSFRHIRQREPPKQVARNTHRLLLLLLNLNFNPGTELITLRRLAAGQGICFSNTHRRPLFGLPCVFGESRRRRRRAVRPFIAGCVYLRDEYRPSWGREEKGEQRRTVKGSELCSVSNESAGVEFCVLARSFLWSLTLIWCVCREFIEFSMNSKYVMTG